MPLKLQSVTISFGPFLETTFEPTAEEADAAWILFVELSTRIATQPFDPEQGSARRALDSLYGLLNTTRETIKPVGPSITAGNMIFPSVGLLFITDHIAPFLTRWNEKLASFELNKPRTLSPHDHELSWEQRTEFVKELGELQEISRQYTSLFGQVCGVRVA